MFLGLCMLSANIFAEPNNLTSTRDYNELELQAKVQKKSKSKKRWHPPFILQRCQRKQFYFGSSIGVGFLRYSDLQGNLGITPYLTNVFDVLKNHPVRGPLRYNRTPLYEFTMLRGFLPFMQAGLSYQFQGNVFVQTKKQRGDSNIVLDYAQFESNLSLNGLFLKFIFESPKAMNIGIASLAPYLGVGVGPAWQTWTNVQLHNEAYRVSNAVNVANEYPITFNQKIVANAAWMLDLGIALQSRQSSSNFTFNLGCKYNQWGQVRSLGAIEDQPERKIGLVGPFKIKTLYQFAPYASVNWIFSVKDKFYNPDGKRACISVVRSRCLPMKSSIWTEANVGVGLLYFSGVEGNLSMNPLQRVDTWTNVPVKYGYIYNKPPVMEFVTGYQFNPWVRLGVSFLHQAGITFQTQLLIPKQANNQVILGLVRGQLTSKVQLNALLAKVYFQFPYSLVVKQMATQPYLGFGIGPGWQTWNRANVYYTAPIIFNYLPLRQKISANAVFSIDAGFRVQHVNPMSTFSITLGCKYNEWGQARSLGKLDQQGMFTEGLSKPFKIKTVYQFAPYLGMQWDFGNPEVSSSKLKGQCSGITKMQISRWWSQFNVGCGFLYFSGLKGNLMGVPQVQFFRVATNVPLKRGLSYNRTPVFEYLFGFRIVNFLSVALSYQNQNGISVSTDVLPANLNNLLLADDFRSQFRADLSLNGLMMKFFIDVPTFRISYYRLKPFMSVGVGSGWQTWNNIKTNYIAYIAANNTASWGMGLRQKISANVIWGLDMGAKLETCLAQKGTLSLILGCRYNQWGQARYMGKIQDQENVKIGLFDPVRIKTVYQFAPYGGVQWNF